MTLDQARQELADLQKKLAAYQHAQELLSYDGVTAAPPGTAENRAETLGVLSQEVYRLQTGPETAALLGELETRREELTPAQARQVQLLTKELRELERVPMEEYVAYQRLVTVAEDAWQRAKRTNDWPLFRPWLGKIFQYQKKIAAWSAPQTDPYDYWLDKFEEGLTRKDCDSFFAALRGRLVPLLDRIREKPQPSREILAGEFPIPAQKELAHRLMDLLGLDRDHVALSTSEHPFTCLLGSHLDLRITTHVYETDFSASLYSVLHEGGHALYDGGSDDAFAYTLLDGGVSMGIHESQSRFYENTLGRSRAFCEYLFPLLCRTFPGRFDGSTPQDLYRAVNRVEPSLIRTEADELTYPLHILIRYELEKAVMAGDLPVADLPGEWNRLYREVLGVEVPDDARGVLQDSHWSGGDIGYFPSYALGSAYGAQYLKKMRESLDLDGCLRRGDFAPINGWFRERIWRHGCLLTPAQVFRSAVGEDFDPRVYADYLEEKFGGLYGL